MLRIVTRCVSRVSRTISSGTLLVTGSTRGGEAIIEGFSDDDYVVTVDLDFNSGSPNLADRLFALVRNQVPVRVG